MLRPDVAEALAGMPSGTHAVLVYDSRENKRDVLFSHLKLGVGKEGLIYVCSEETPQMIKSELEGFGLDVPAIARRGDLEVKNYDEVYIERGKVDAPKIMGKFAEAAWGYKGKGLMGLRGAAEMSCFFKEHKVPELMEYEKALNRTFSFPGKGVCAYNLVEMGMSGNLEILWPLLRAHALVIMTGPNGGFALEPERVKETQVAAIQRQVLK